MKRQAILTSILGILFYLSSGHYALCQEYSWKHYSIADGLPQTQIRKLFQDSRGYIWIGTKGGFSKFDGVEFENYTIKDNLANEIVEFFHEDSLGRIIIGLRYGAVIWEKGKLEPLPLPDSDRQYGFLVDRENRIWIKYRGREFICIDQGTILDAHPLTHFLRPNETIIYGVQNRSNGHIMFITTDNNLIDWDGSRANVKKSAIPLNGTGFDREGSLYSISEGGRLYDHDKQRFLPIQFDLMNFGSMLINSERDIYFRRGIDWTILYHYDGNQIKEFKKRFNMITTVLVDDEENLWVGTESGLWRLESGGFKNYYAPPNPNFYTWNVLQDKKNNYWFASFHHGLKKFDGEAFADVEVDHLFEKFNQYQNSQNWQYFYSGGLKDKHGDLYFSTVAGVIKYDGSEFDWYHTGIPETIMYIYEDDKEDKLLLASAHNGIIEIDRDKIPYYHSDRGPREHTGLVTSIVKDKHGRLWISGSNGISIKEADYWRHLPDEQDSIDIGAISMIKDYEDNLWLGSNDGLYFYDYDTLKKVATTVFDRQIGVLNMTNDQELLIGSIEGIGLLDLATFYADGNETIRYFDSHNGFQGTECKHNSSFKDDQGHIWICTSDRVVEVIPDEIRSNPYPPRVYVKEISVMNENMEWQAAYGECEPDGKYIFEARHEDIRFNYHGISHSAPLGVKYQTMLEGYDTRWSATTTERYRTYTNLPNGSYTFKVKAANIDGIWSEEVAQANILLKPAWHEISSVRLGGLISLILAAAGFGYLYSNRQKRRRDQRYENEVKIAKLQFRSLQGLVSPHFTFNAINSIASMVYRENRDEAYHYFTKFSRLIRAAFDNSEETTRTVKDELKFVKNYLDIEKMRFKNRFDFQITVDKNIITDWKIPKMVIQIYVENAIKHGLIHREYGGMLEVRLSMGDDHLKILIKDNGIGRARAQVLNDQEKSLGKGTKIMNEYFELLNRFNEHKIFSNTFDLFDSDGNAAGTEVLVSIPLSFKYSI